MYKLNKIVAPRSVIWAKKSIYYDKPELSNPDKTSMFLVTYVNEDYFFGCPLTMNPSPKNSTVLLKSHYPLKRDSRVNEYLYKLTGQDIIGDELFKVTRGTLEYFKRCLYQRIVLGNAESPEEYNDIFVEEYLKDYRPTVNNIVVYPSAEKVFRYYYVAGETEKDLAEGIFDFEEQVDNASQDTSDNELHEIFEETTNNDLSNLDIFDDFGDFDE